MATAAISSAPVVVTKGRVRTDAHDPRQHLAMQR